MASREEHTLRRPCEAIVIPYGTKSELPAGTVVRVMQRLGGALTVAADFGGLYRIDPENFDALGLEKPESATPAAHPTDRPLEDRVWDELRTCFDPEIPVNIVELGLVYDCTVEPSTQPERQNVRVKMTLTAPGCGMGPTIAADAQSKVMSLEGVKNARVDIVWDPPWNQSMISEEGRMKLGMI